MRVLICGNCTWTYAKPIFDLMHAYSLEIPPKDLTFISGMAPGADWIAYIISHALDAKCDEYPWNRDGEKKAKQVAIEKGVEFDHKASRNQWMRDSGVDVCHAFAKDLPGQWSGTRDMVNRCLPDGIPCFWHTNEAIYKIVSDHRQKHDMVVEKIGDSAASTVEIKLP